MDAQPKYPQPTQRHMKSQVPPDTVFATKRHAATGTVIECYRRPDKLFVAICTNHGTSSPPMLNRIDSYRASQWPEGWCAGCKKLLGIEDLEYVPQFVFGTRECEMCGILSTRVTHYRHVDSAADGILACRDCHRTEKFAKRYRKLFAELVDRRREEWRGMSKERRRAALKRIAVVGRNEGTRR